MITAGKKLSELTNEELAAFARMITRVAEMDGQDPLDLMVSVISRLSPTSRAMTSSSSSGVSQVAASTALFFGTEHGGRKVRTSTSRAPGASQGGATRRKVQQKDTATFM